MAPKKATKKAAGGKKTAKGTRAPAKAAGTKRNARPAKAPAKKATAPTRKPPPRAVKKQADAASPEDDAVDEESVDEPSPPPRRPTKAGPKKPTAKKRPSTDSDSSDDVPLSKRQRITKISKSAAGAVAEDQPPVGRPRRGVRSPSPVEEANAEQTNANDTEQEDQLIDDAANSPDVELSDADELAAAQFNDNELTLRDLSPVRARFRLQVYRDPEEGPARLFYRMRFWLTRTDQGNDAEEVEAGYIHAHRIAKPNAAHPHANNQDWLTLLRARLPPNTSDSIRETSLCLRALFTQAGAPSAARVRDAAVRQSLIDQSLVFIEMIHIRRPYQNNRLLQPLFEQFYALLQRLPEWFAFSGNLVLVPGMPDNARGRRVWEQAGDTEEDVERILRRVYGNQGFAVWADGVNVGGEAITVMGRSVGGE